MSGGRACAPTTRNPEPASDQTDNISTKSRFIFLETSLECPSLKGRLELHLCKEPRCGQADRVHARRRPPASHHRDFYLELPISGLEDQREDPFTDQVGTEGRGSVARS